MAAAKSRRHAGCRSWHRWSGRRRHAVASEGARWLTGGREAMLKSPTPRKMRCNESRRAHARPLDQVR
eukprot:2910962-Pyramimonas_sp.AAC.1